MSPRRELQGTMPRIVTSAFLAVLVGCGTGPNGSITVTVESLPSTTREVSVTVNGTVSRTPATDDPITVAVAGGQRTISDSLVGGGGFSFVVLLNPNTENQLAVTASDPSGVVSDPLILVIHHDDQGPVIEQMVPGKQALDAPLDTPIEVVFGEPLQAPGGSGNVLLFHNSMPVNGSFVLSGDAKKVTFTPAEPLQPNSVYELRFVGYEDETGNPPDPAGEACFVTTAAGFVSHLARDTADIGFQRGNPEPGLIPVDLQSLRMARRDSTLFAVIEFAQPRTFALYDDTSAIAILEIDTDQSAATGFTSLRDTIFAPFPELSSGLGVEMLVGLEPNSVLGDSAYVGVYTAPLEFDVLDTFIPGTCGPYFGFHTTTLLDSAGDDGMFDYTLLGFAFGNDGDYVDPMPEAGHLTADVTATVTAAGPYRTDMIRPRITGRKGRIENLSAGPAPVRRR